MQQMHMFCVLQHRRIMTIITLGPPCAGAARTQAVQFATGQPQPCALAQTNPTPVVTLPLTLWGARGQQGLSRGVLVVFCKPKTGDLEANLDQYDQQTTQCCAQAAHCTLGRVIVLMFPPAR